MTAGNAAPAPESVLLRAALAYAARFGWAVLPLHAVDAQGRCTCRKPGCPSPGKHPRTQNGLKDASKEPAAIRAWWQRWPGANVGIATGAISRLCVIDVDLHGADGFASLRQLEGALECLPSTPAASTGSGGRHIYLALGDDATVRNSSGQLAPGIDVRGEGGYVVAPPSVHATGAHYQWLPDRSPADSAPAPLPAAWRAEMAEKRPGALSAVYETAEPIQPADGLPSGSGRNNTLTSLAGGLRRRGVSADGVLAALRGANAQFAAPLDDAEVEKVARSVARYEPGPAGAEYSRHDSAPERQVFALTDVGNAERLIAQHGADLRYCEPLGGWLCWTGMHWQRDQSGEVTRRAIATVRALYREAAAEENPDRREALVKWALKSEAAARVEAMIRLGHDLAGVATPAESFDRDAWLLACQNGTLALRSGQLRPSRREDYITRALPIAYDPAARCPTWLAFLRRILGDNAQLVDFLQRAIGYSLTGDARERVFFLLHGAGRNGKSTLLETLGHLLGGYARTAEASTFLERNQERVSNDLAMLAGARFVAVSEGHAGQRLHETLIKRVTGRDSITARFLFRENFTFTPQFKLWLATNHKPEVRDAGDAMWGRIRLLPFTVQIPEAEQDKALPEKLRAELPGILAWAIAGCRAWQQHGLAAPTEVLAATEAYRDEMDVLGPFIDGQCVLDGQAWATSGDLYRAYADWCERAREKPLGQKAFGLHLAERGFRSRRGTGGVRHWVGVRLRQGDEPLAVARVADGSLFSDSSRVSPSIGKESGIEDRPVTDGTFTPETPIASDATAPENGPDCWLDGCSRPAEAGGSGSPDGVWCAEHAERGVLHSSARARGWPRVDLGGGLWLQPHEWDNFVRAAAETEIGFVWDALGLSEGDAAP